MIPESNVRKPFKTAKEILQGFANRQKEVHLTYDVVLQAMEEYANQSKWIDVKEQLPEKSIDCNCVMKNGNVVTCSFDANTKHFNRYKNNIDGDRCKNYIYTAVTHWQPLPTAPPTK